MRIKDGEIQIFVGNLAAKQVAHTDTSTCPRATGRCPNSTRKAQNSTCCCNRRPHNRQRGIKGNYGLTLTGSGPASWFHNGDKETGIADVVGLVWKTVAGLRLKNGVLEYIMELTKRER